MTILGRSRMWALVPLLAIAPFQAPDARAQLVATSFDELRTLVKPGDTIHVTDATGRKTKGRLGELSASSLQLLVLKDGPGGRATFVPQASLSERDVRQIRLERGDPVWNGTLIGLAVVGGPWLALCAPNDWCYYNEYGGENLFRYAALISSGVAAGIGMLVDASMRERTTVYYRSPDEGSAGLQVSPLLSKSAVGMQVSLRFRAKKARRS